MIIGSVWCSRITCSPPTGQPPHNIILIFSASKHHALRELPAVVHGWQRGHRNVSGVGRRRRKKRGKKGFLPRCKGDCFGCDLSASAWDIVVMYHAEGGSYTLYVVHVVR